MPSRRNSAANASSVSRLPREQMQDITSERLAWVKTSASSALAKCGHNLRAPLGLCGRMHEHLLEHAGPLGIARIELVLRKLPSPVAPPRLGGEALQQARPAPSASP
jgi:hypothetical protein